MSRVQELIDERMKENPMGLAKELLEACKAEAEAMPELYRLTVTWVTAMAYIDKQHDPAAKLSTSKQTLTSIEGTFLASMFSGRFTMEKDENGHYFIDRDGKHFRHILNFLRGPSNFRPVRCSSSKSEKGSTDSRAKDQHVSVVVHAQRKFSARDGVRNFLWYMRSQEL